MENIKNIRAIKHTYMKTYMTELIRHFLAAVGFLSIIPTGRTTILTPEELGHFPAFYPAVGLLFGLDMFILWHLCSLVLPPAPTAVLVVVFLVVVNRGFHLDGLADAADALFCHKSRDQKLLIMKDSRQGTFGVLAIVLNILLKVQFVALVAPLAPWVLILWPVWGRLAASVVAVRSLYVGDPSGLGKWMVDNSTNRELLWALGFTILLSAFGGVAAVLVALLAGGLGLVFTWIWEKALGGITGDLLGATIELTEIITIILFFIIIS